ncbi:MAG: GtrA family protein [Acidobacteria bacterium]|nr:GtrA family protein [Acidobacteriota bacterium]
MLKLPPNKLKVSWIWNWCKFNLVGLLGVALQLSLSRLFAAINLDYLLATFIAVEITILHNFYWHEHWTWREQTLKSNHFFDKLFRLVKFNSTTGAISLIGNLVLMKFFVGAFHLPITFANLLAIISCSTLNFLVSHRVVFRNHQTV